MRKRMSQLQTLLRAIWSLRECFHKYFFVHNMKIHSFQTVACCRQDTLVYGHFMHMPLTCLVSRVQLTRVYFFYEQLQHKGLLHENYFCFCTENKCPSFRLLINLLHSTYNQCLKCVICPIFMLMTSCVYFYTSYILNYKKNIIYY